jgi:hypothetical protein
MEMVLISVKEGCQKLYETQLEQGGLQWPDKAVTSEGYNN